MNELGDVHSEFGNISSGLSRTDLLRRAAGGALILGAPGILAGEALASDTQTPKRGGRLRVAIAGAGASETLNPTIQPSEIDSARQRCLFERLVNQAPDGSLYNQLALEFIPNRSASVWQIKLKPGVVWHDGSPFTADDVVYTLRYILDPKNKAEGASDLSGVLTPKGIRRRGPLTVELQLEAPSALLPTTLSSRSLSIFKKGTKSFDRPIGTGPWKFVSWTRGQRSLFARNPNYRIHGGPYLAQLELITISEGASRYSALAAGQVHAIADLDYALAKSVKANRALRVLDAKGGQFTCQTMWCDTAPFNDNRVRRAFRLLVDRQQLVDSALLGYGTIGNDLHGLIDPDYARSLPQRAHDPERAKALLKAAGQEGLEVTLYTSEVVPAAIASATLIAEQAKQAGVKINLMKVPPDQYWSTAYLKQPFAVSEWAVRSLDAYMAAGFTRKSPFNETHWYSNSFDALWHKTRRTLDAKKRRAQWVDLQRILWDQGGEIIWGFRHNVDGYSAKVRGLKPSVVRPLGYYDFTDVYLS